MTFQTLTSPGGHQAQVAIRDDTTDLAVAHSTFARWDGEVEDEYRLRDLPRLSGTALDIGAHIGTVSLALLADHPELSVIAVEPVPENAAVIRDAAERNGWTERVTVIEAAVGGRVIRYGDESTDFARSNRYIGNLKASKGRRRKVASMTLADLVQMAGGSVPFLKTDCEGGEWAMLAEPAISKVQRIAGEWHGEPGEAGIVALLSPTHDVTTKQGVMGGLFWAVRR